MNNYSNLIEEIYFGFQIVLLTVLLNFSFPILGEGSFNQYSWLTLLFLAYMVYRFLIVIKRHFNKESSYKISDIVISSIIEGLFIVLLLNTDIHVMYISKIVIVYILVQTLRVPGKMRYVFFLMSVLIECYILLTTDFMLNDWIGFLTNVVLIFFINTSIGMIFKELQNLQMDNDFYMKELKSTNEQLITLSNTDYLTGLNNHKSFYITISNYFEHAKSKCFSMALMDIDDFKVINDTYGHLVGDEVLATLADILKSNVRETDFVARYGGEEFVVLFPGINLDQAEVLCERLRRQVENHLFEALNQKFNVTISIGLSSINDSPGHEIKSFIKGVDDLLYDAKKAGKNQVVKNPLYNNI